MLSSISLTARLCAPSKSAPSRSSEVMTWRVMAMQLPPACVPANLSCARGSAKRIRERRRLLAAPSLAMLAQLGELMQQQRDKQHDHQRATQGAAGVLAPMRCFAHGAHDLD